MSKQPFIFSEYTLNTSQLRQITYAETVIIAQTLVKMEPWYSLNYKRDNLSNYLHHADPLLYRYGIVINQQIVGIVCVRYPWLQDAYLELLAIYPICQGRGIGHEVLQWIEAELLKAHCYHLWLLVSSFNYQAQRFYQKLGFVEMGQLEDFVVVGYDEILLRKVLIN
ncbi:GCN5-related N-acetyltransferase [Beggiatoa sp. PS]|nr:GCN5-related N-acetyltransferase [Beggiatoa sp. PS]